MSPIWDAMEKGVIKHVIVYNSDIISDIISRLQFYHLNNDIVEHGNVSSPNGLSDSKTEQF